ncbi:hypothetical protein DPEC_G00177960, partial [Dallia pectoralis]
MFSLIIATPGVHLLIRRVFKFSVFGLDFVWNCISVMCLCSLYEFNSVLHIERLSLFQVCIEIQIWGGIKPDQNKLHKV